MAIPTITESDRARFEKRLKLDAVTGCLLWQGPANGGTARNYGQFRLGGRAGRIYGSHVIAWFIAGRELPPKSDLSHHCPGGDNPRCCNVDHLKPLTRREHARDRTRKGQGSKSRRGLPFGVSIQQSGRFLSYVTVGSLRRSFGTYDTLEQAASVSALVRDVALQVRFLAEAP